MNKQVLSIEQMQTLIDKGVDVSGASIGSRYYDAVYHKYFKEDYEGEEIGNDFNFFTLQDILEMLPTFIRWSDRLYDLHSDCKHYIGYSIDWEDAIDEYINGDELYLVDRSGDTMIDAAYQMLLWCIENGHIKTKQP